MKMENANVKASEKAYKALLAMGQHAKGIQKAKSELKKKEQGAYAIGIGSAIAETYGVPEEKLAEARAGWFAAMALLMENIRKDKGGVPAMFGAEPADPTNKKGNKYKVPSSVSTINSLVRRAWSLDVPLWKLERDKDGNIVPKLGEDGMPIPDSIQAIVKANTAKAEKQAQSRLAEASPFEKLKMETAARLEDLKGKLTDMPERDSAIVKWIHDAIVSMLDAKPIEGQRPATASAQAPAPAPTPEETVGEALDQATAAAEEASKAQERAKPANKRQSRKEKAVAA